MRVDPFNQPPPELGNQLEDDPALRGYLARVLPEDVQRDVMPELREMGELAGGDLRRRQQADRENEPVLTQWSAWGERIDHIELTPVWKHAERVAAERGVVATAYERKHGRFSRVHQFALAYLFAPSTDVYSCPLAMTDGAAHTLVELGNQKLTERALPRLTSRDPARFWTSGQWMTESTGGSDVGRSETVAVRDDDGTWRLWGRKWFTSAASSQMTLTLGRPEGAGPGGSGLALFYVETRDDAGRLQNIRIHRLKDKLGTRKVPTAELFLEGTPAELVTEAKNGIKNIAPMLNITRTWNAISSASGMGRGLALARDYARKRVAFQEPLSKKALHVDTLAALAAEHEGALQLAFFVAELVGRHEARELDEHHARLLRLLTPIAKLTTAKQAVAAASELLECFGGAGYVEDTGLPVLLRDAQVLPIWEGTTNVLSLDTLRALSRDPAALVALRDELGRAAETARDAELVRLGRAALEAVDHARTWLESTMKASPDRVEAGARRFALTLGRATELALVVRQAQWSLDQGGDRRAAAAASRLASAGIDLVLDREPDDSALLAGS